MVWIYWLLSAILVAAQQEVNSFLMRQFVAVWTCAFFILGVRVLPGWADGHARLITFAVASRLCLIGRESLLVQLVAAAFVAGTCLSLVFGENSAMVTIREVLLHPDARPAPRKDASLGFIGSAMLLGYGMMYAEVLIVMLGCLCIYSSVASIVVGDDPLSRALVIALCGLVTMLLSEIIQEQLLPLQSVLGSMGTAFPLFCSILSGSAQDGLPFDVWMLRDLLRDAAAAVGGGQRL
jgi:hypothetical protein